MAYKRNVGNWPQRMTVKVVHSSRLRYIGEDGDYCIRNAYVTFPERVDKRTASSAMHELFDTYCQHEYDCCGNWYANAYTHKMRRMRARTWKVPIAAHMNI